MWKSIMFILTGVLTSFYFFPFEFTFLPRVNVKMILAVIGLCILGIKKVKKEHAQIDKDILVLSVWAVFFSLVCLFSVTWNGTSDYAYVGYVISMWVWLSAAYTVCTVIKCVHGYITVELIVKYLTVVCVFQCFAALIIDNYPNVKSFIDRYIEQEQTLLTSVKRLYGIGARLDVAGSRFAAVLVMLAFVFIKKFEQLGKKDILIGGLLFVVIAIVGNMIARTTTVGLILAFFILLISKYTLTSKVYWKMIGGGLLMLLITIPFVIYFYNQFPFFHKQLRFAFEGFFTLAEKGIWDVDSNETLKAMYVFPDNIKTWLIGDGYFDSAWATDPYFIGKIEGGYYMGTDVGYLRFVFYSGLFGLLAFSSFIMKVCLVCIRKIPSYKTLFLLLLAVNFIIWFKVATDIFLVFALFLVMPRDENDAYQERLLSGK